VTIPVVLDLSHYNSISSWPFIVAHGIQGIIHKATQGTTFVDPTYGSRKIQAKQQGLLFGAYHFLSPGRITQQADYFVATAKPDSDTLLAVDHEDRSVPVDDLLLFMDTVEMLAGRSIVLYSGNVIEEQAAVGLSDDQVAALAKRRLWLPEYTHGQPQWLVDIWPQWWLWQYAGSDPRFPGSAPGIKGLVDLDAYSGTDLAGEWSGVGS
jgi:lysozyme